MPLAHDLIAPAPVTVAKAAEMLNVSPRSVKNAIAVRDHGVPELADAVRSGEIAVSAAAEIARQPAEEQKALHRACQARVVVSGAV